MRKTAPRITQTKHIVTLLQKLQYKGQFNISEILEWLLDENMKKGILLQIKTMRAVMIFKNYATSFKFKLKTSIRLAENLVNSTNV